VFKKVDTCAAEFKSFTPYMYSTYQRNFSFKIECESEPTNKKKIIILGGGPNRIGQGIEFDYCCCQASLALKEAKYETIMVNCNPETVSTDYDTSDRLYFEPLIDEYVFNIIKREKSIGNVKGVIAQFGGQTPIKLAKFLYENKLPILGTQYSSIDLAEDRDRFRNLLNKLNLKQAESGIARTFPQAIKIADAIIVLSLQKERMMENLLSSIDSYSLDYGLTAEKLSLNSKEIPILHPGPINRGIEISSKIVDNYPNCLINNQVANGIPIRMALLYLLQKYNK